MADNSSLSQDIHTLGSWLGVIIQEQNGMDAYELVEEIRAMSKARRSGDSAAAFKLADRLENLPSIRRTFSSRPSQIIFS